MATINEKLTAVANAIRAKTGGTSTLTLDQMASSLNAIANKTSSDLTASGATVTVPAGNYKAQATKSVATATQATPSVSINSSGLITASATQTAGYVSAGTKSGTKQLTTQAAKTITPSTSSQTAVASGVYTTGAVTVAAIPSSYVQPSATKAAATITPSTSNQTIAAGTYCSGAQTIAGDADLVASNIKKGANIFGVAGSYEGVELNFNVVGGTSAPSNPSENTIWVNTNTEITSWIFSSTTPETPEGGMVWFLVGTVSDYEFNALKNNGIKVYPGSAKQYVSGSWKDVDASSYANGEFRPWWDGTLFDAGNQYEAITGGWVQAAYGIYGSENTAAGKLTIGNTIYLEDNGGQSCVSVRTVKKIDLTKFNRLTFEGSGSSEYYICVSTSTSGNPSIRAGSKSLDVSSLSGGYYVGAISRNWSSINISKFKLS